MPASAVVVMGASGSGKSTIGRLLADRLACDFVDADDLHPDANKAKMHAGIPLTDEDRSPWLHLVGRAIATEVDAGREVVVACSALKRAYRDILRSAAPGVEFLYLDGSRELLAQRLSARSGHFMSPTLLDSQLATLEPLQSDELGIVVGIADNPASMVDAAVAALQTFDED
ncbi:gluconokinase [Naasia lichenicola]|uniref:gluconokinase n=1 Tax=Naasia lichenicola TaxID=2565933 RepID=UPI002FCDFBE8